MPRTYNFAYRQRNPEMFPFVCGICIPIKRFRASVDKDRHDNMKHGGNIPIVSNQSKRNAETHPFVCDICPKRFAKLKGKEDHTRMKHGATTGNLSSSKQAKPTVSNQSKRNAETHPFICDICPKRFAKFKGKDDHTRMKHGATAGNPSSSKQDKPIVSNQSKRNAETHPFICDICPKRFAKLKGKEDHTKIKHGATTANPSNSKQARAGCTQKTQSSESVFSRYSTPNTQILHSRLSSSSLCPLYSLQSERELSVYVKDKIEPDATYIASCNAVVDNLCKFMQNNFPDNLRPSRIIKGGSLGKGTAVKDLSDADLVVFLANKEEAASISTLRANIEKSILPAMGKYLDRYSNCTLQGYTPHAVKVSLSCHDADILPSVDVIAKASRLRDVYDEMRNSPEDREYYSAALAPLQIDFVCHQPTKLKTLIRLVKYWRKTAFTESTGYKRLPSSYLLELITIGEWQDNCGKEQFDLRKGFFNVLRALKDYCNMKHLWTEHYNSEDLDSSHRMTTFYVMDPANPFNNVMTACNCWPEVAETAQVFLKSPLFEGICEHASWSKIIAVFENHMDVICTQRRVSFRH